MKKGLIPVDRRLSNGTKQVERADWTDADSDALEGYLTSLQKAKDDDVAATEAIKKQMLADPDELGMWSDDQENGLKMFKEKQAKQKTQCDFFFDRMIPKTERMTLKKQFKSCKHKVS